MGNNRSGARNEVYFGYLCSPIKSHSDHITVLLADEKGKASAFKSIDIPNTSNIVCLRACSLPLLETVTVDKIIPSYYTTSDNGDTYIREMTYMYVRLYDCVVKEVMFIFEI